MAFKNTMNRRQVIAVSSTGLLSACTSCPCLTKIPPTDQRASINDAHAHFFNASDLPISGFLEFVLIPDYLGDVPEVALALIDIAAKILKSFAMTAAQEMKRQYPPFRKTVKEDVGTVKFAKALAVQIEKNGQQVSRKSLQSLDPLNELNDSYLALATLINQVDDPKDGSIKSASESALLKDGTETAPFGSAISVDYRTVKKIVEQGYDVSSGNKKYVMPRDRKAKLIEKLSIAKVWALIKWAHLMVQTRCYHVHQYIRFLETSQFKVDSVVNLLVDYDAWLNDTPAAGSSHGQQVEFWTDYSRRLKDRIAVKNFGGYDPLKHVEETLSGRFTLETSPYFTELKSWILAAKNVDLENPARRALDGFKVYPPMGFNVHRNAGMSVAEDRAGEFVRGKWRGKSWPIDQFGKLLDGALDHFFDFCATHDVPILAHASDSNEASTGSGQQASPRYWLERARRIASDSKQLRVCLGHVDSISFQHWEALSQIIEMNNAGRSKIYFDIGYSERFLTGGGRQVLNRLAQIDKAGEYSLFGSDWIMLAQHPRHKNYVEAVYQAVDNHDFWGSKKDAIFSQNFQNFIG